MLTESLTLQEQILERQGCNLHYWVGGVEGRTTIVFTHGAGVDHRSLNAQVEAAAREYRVLTWDVRGHGLSQPVGAPFTIPLAVDDLLAILGGLGCTKAVFVGHSNGSYISQELAYRHPEMVQALVIADGTCITWPRSSFDRWLLRSSSNFLAILPFETLKKFGLPYFSARKDVQAYIYEAFSMLDKPTFLAIWGGVITCLHDEPGYKITQPMLLVHGDGDQTGDIRKIAPLWAAKTPNCRYEVIPNALHLAPMDNPDYFNKLLMDFLDKWSQPPGA
jgi:3-oxoadipate enol-lactonase